MTLEQQLRGCATKWTPGQTGHDVMVAAADRIAYLELTLRTISADTYGTEIMDTDEQRAEVLGRHLRRLQSIAREALTN